MASGPITSWQIDGEKMKTVRDFIFLGSIISADSDCSCEIKRCLLLGRKVMTNLNSIFKSKDITLLTKVILRSSVNTAAVRSLPDAECGGEQRVLEAGAPERASNPECP